LCFTAATFCEAGVAMTSGAAEDLKSGAGVIVFATGKSADGAYEATRVTVGRDGVKRPM
jgi:hypothetical protein